jgi:sortase A
MAFYGATKIRAAERVFLAIGLTLLALWGVARFHGSAASRAAVERFKAVTATSTIERAIAPQASSSVPRVDFTQWSPQRIAAYKDSLAAKGDLPLAILRIPKINLEVPVFNDTDDLTLNRGVGRIVGTAQIGQPGNVGIAGHRDGFFRGLKDVGSDDFVELVRPGHTDQYVITGVQIVSPEDVQVLDPTPVPTLTLITCYPFYYVGSAPQRYVVTASMQISRQPDVSKNTNSISTGKKINKRRKQDDPN